MCPARKLLRSPFKQTLSKKRGLDPQGLAHRFKGERTLSFAPTQPFLGFHEQSPTRTRYGCSVVLKASQGVLEHREHKALDRPNRAFVALTLVELLGRDYIGHEQRSECAVFPFHVSCSSLNQTG
jgi:hypothetical protein